jgi:hypothetical protein
MNEVAMEHVPNAFFIPYLITGDRFYVDQGKLWANAITVGYTGGWTQPDTDNFPGWYRGRDGSTGNERLLAGTGLGREFAWPFRACAIAAAMVPDDDDRRDYMLETVQNNLDYVSDYHAYYLTNGLGGVAGGALVAERINGPPVAQYTKTVTGATSAPASVITTSGDHHFTTGDYITLSNTVQYQITVLSSTTFTVPADVSGASITSATKLAGRYNALWRIGYSVYMIDWAMRQGLWTDKANVYNWIDAFCQLMIDLNVDDSTFVSDPTKFGWYPVLAQMDGKYITDWYDSFAKMNENNTEYFDNGSTPGWSQSNDGSVYGGHFLEREAFYRIGLRRGLTDAQSAITRIYTVTDYAAARTTNDLNRGYAIHFGSEDDS